jgi:RND family efflux transporter MFP subunit
MRAPTLLPAMATAIVLLLAACGREAAAPAKSVATPALETLIVAAGDAGGGISWDGVVQAQEQALLSAQTGGRVTHLAADVDQRVARGAVLLRLTDQEQRAAVEAAQAQLRAADAQLVDAAARFRRASELVEDQLVSRDDFDRVRAVHDAANATRDAAAAALAQAREQLAYTTVVAPYAGIVAARHVELGETVAPGEPLFTMYAPGRLRVEVQLPQAEAEAVRASPVATVSLSDGRAITPTQIIVYPAADPAAHSNTVRLLLPVAERLPRPGQTVKVRFEAAAGPGGIWLPASAVVLRGELAAAYVVREDGIVLRQLRIGRSQAGRLEVIAGLSAGEAVAADPDRALQWLRDRREQGAAAHE